MVLLCVSGVSPLDLDLLLEWPGNIKSKSSTHHLLPLVSWYLVQYLSDIIHCHSGIWENRVMCSNTFIIMTNAMDLIITQRTCARGKTIGCIVVIVVVVVDTKSTNLEI